MNQTDTKTTIDDGTRFSARTVVFLIVATAGFVLGYADIRYRLVSLEKAVTEAAADRWTQADDCGYMERFALINGLELPTHRRTGKPTNKKGGPE